MRAAVLRVGGSMVLAAALGVWVLVRCTLAAAATWPP